MPVTAGNGLPKGYMSGYPPASDRCQVVEVTWCLEQPFKCPVRVEDAAPLSKDPVFLGPVSDQVQQLFQIMIEPIHCIIACSNA